MTGVADGVACTHACSMACGRTYDVMVIQVVDASTLFLCMPCGVNFWAGVAKAMVEPEDPEIKEIVGNATLDDVVLVTDPNPGYGIRGYSDPAAGDDFEFDGAVAG